MASQPSFCPKEEELEQHLCRCPCCIDAIGSFIIKLMNQCRLMDHYRAANQTVQQPMGLIKVILEKETKQTQESDTSCCCLFILMVIEWRVLWELLELVGLCCCSEADVSSRREKQNVWLDGGGLCRFLVSPVIFSITALSEISIDVKGLKPALFLFELSVFFLRFLSSC